MKTPRDLGKQGKEFWKKAHSEYELTEAHDLERLKMACRTLDDLKESEDRVKADGMYVVNRYGSTVEHPAMKTVRDLRLLFVKIIRELALDVAVPEAKPPRRY